jgi:biotin carboxyl carrier protein
MKFVVRIGSEEKQVQIEEINGFYEIDIDGTKHTVDCRNFGHKDYLSLLINNKSYLIESAPVNSNQGTYYANVMGRHYDLEVLDELLLAAREADESSEGGGPHTVISPMPGLIIDVKVKAGDTVAAGTPVVIMEAMKMQNALISEVTGVVTEVHVAPNDTVDSQAPLVVIERTA